MSDEPTLYLDVDCLCSKWGFNDGDCPDHLLDYWEEVGVDWPQLNVDWHQALRALVRAHLVPAIEAAGHTVEVYDIETIHNPIRARSLDGVAVDDYDGRRAPFELCVTVPYTAIAAVCGLEAEPCPSAAPHGDA